MSLAVNDLIPLVINHHDELEFVGMIPRGADLVEYEGLSRRLIKIWTTVNYTVRKEGHIYHSYTGPQFPAAAWNEAREIGEPVE